MTHSTMTASAVETLICEALLRSDTSPENAAAVARALVASELAGQGGHGLRRVEAYCAQAAVGKVKGHAVVTSDRLRPGALAVDGSNGFAYPALEHAVEWLPDAARGQGIAIAGIRRSHHCGVLGCVVEALAEKGVLAIMVGNAPAAMAPWGGNRPLYGTNPLAFAAPVADGDPIVIDISLSKVARGKIMAASQKGDPIPEGWALDSDGNPTTDAKAGLAGMMVPLGDAKGTALALMVELLCAGLTGANYSTEVSSFFDDKGDPPGTGQTLIAIDPSAFGTAALDRFADLARSIDEMDGARVPGRRRQDIKRDYLENGIPVDDQLKAKIEAIGR